jgi:hypothetical protein
VDAQTVAEAIGRFRISYANERDLQQALVLVFAEAGIPAEAEVVLGPGCRIDFLVDRTGVEVKVDGSPAEVRRQVDRYLEFDTLDELLLVTTRARHRVLAGQHGEKRVGVLLVGGVV